MGAYSNGGRTHVRYAHAHRPRDLEVRCPRCGGLARARKPSEEGCRFLVVDVGSPGWNVDDWAITCTACPHRASGIAYEALPECYWSFEVGESVVWAWNRDHLAFLRRCLLGRMEREEPYRFFEAYVPREWKLDARRIVAHIERRLEGGRS